MKLYHVSEEESIEEFIPRVSYREDMDQNVGVVWAVCERTLPNFLTPRDCPRVTYHVHKDTLEEDKKRYLSSNVVNHCVAIEHRWVEQMKNTTLTIYEFDSENFELQDEVAGYYISKCTEKPTRKRTVTNLFKALEERKVEVRILPELFTLRDQIIASSFHWSMCRMKNARRDD